MPGFDACFEGKLGMDLTTAFTKLMMNNSELRGVCVTGGGIVAQPGGTNSAWHKCSAPRDTNDSCARSAAARYGKCIDDAVYSTGVPQAVWPFLHVHVTMPYKGDVAVVTVHVIDAAAAKQALKQHQSSGEIVDLC